MLNVSRTCASAQPAVIIAPIHAAFLEIKKAGIFDAKAVASVKVTNFLSQPLTVLKGVSAAGAALIAAKGIVTLRDLIERSPTRMINTEPESAKAAYGAHHVMLAAMHKYGIPVDFKDAIHTTMAIAIDPATGISFSR